MRITVKIISSAQNIQKDIKKELNLILNIYWKYFMNEKEKKQLKMWRERFMNVAKRASSARWTKENVLYVEKDKEGSIFY